MDNLSKIRVSSEGDCGVNGGPNGDLFVVVYVEPSKYYRREGINVFTEISISPVQATLGDTIIVKTLDGDKEVVVPSGTQHGNFTKIKGAGVPVVGKPSQKGDQIVIFNILIPEKLSDEEKALYTKLYELQTGKQPQKSIISKVKGVFK